MTRLLILMASLFMMSFALADEPPKHECGFSQAWAYDEPIADILTVDEANSLESVMAVVGGTLSGLDTVLAAYGSQLTPVALQHQLGDSASRLVGYGVTIAALYGGLSVGL